MTFPGLPGLFFVLALIKKGSRPHLEEAQAFARMPAGARNQDSIQELLLLLEPVILDRLGKPVKNDSYFMTQGWKADPFLAFFIYLFQTWQGREKT